MTAKNLKMSKHKHFTILKLPLSILIFQFSILVFGDFDFGNIAQRPQS